MNITAYGNSLTGSSGINGDNFYISPDSRLYVLADGASGAGKMGKVIMSSTCVDIARQFACKSVCLSPAEYISALFSKVNQSLIEISQQERVLSFGTIVIALIHCGELWVTTYGDSPAYLLTSGKILRIARNQKRYENLIDEGFVTREQYETYIHSMHERMWSCFDRFLPEIVPDNVIEHYKLSPGDIFFACSDGLSDWITPEQVFAEVKNHDVKNAIDSLISSARCLALENHSFFDDITAIVAVTE